MRFLNHPKVKASPLGKRLAFLEHKGLNDSEIALALKRANISSDDVKLAMDLANSNNAAAASATTSSSVTHHDGVSPSPPLPPRAAGAAGMQVVQQPPPPQPPAAGWGWGARIGGAVAFFALGGAATLLAAKYLFGLSPGGTGEQQGETKQQDGQAKVGQDKTDRLSAELQSLRASQEALAGQVREAFVAMKESVESQTQQASLRSTGEAPPRKTAATTTAHDETIASLKTEIKTLRAMLLDTRTAESAATRASTVADLPSYSIPSSSSSSTSSSAASPVGLPSWQMASKRTSVAQPSSASSSSTDAPTSSPAPASSAAAAVGKPSAPKPYERRAAASKAEAAATSANVVETPAASSSEDEPQVTESSAAPAPADAAAAGLEQQQEEQDATTSPA